MRVPKFGLKFDLDQIERFKQISEEILTADKPISNGEWVEKFEDQFARFVGAKYAVAVGSGTDALEVALRTLEVRDKTIIIPTNTMIATALAVERAQASFLPIDIEDQTFTLNPTILETVLNNLRAKVGAVIIVHIGGIISRHIPEIVRLCRDYGVPLIEDAAQAHGSTFGKHKAGNIGALGCFSFSATKVMTTAEGGAVTTNDQEYYEKMKFIRNFGSSPEDIHLHTLVGGNFKMTEFQAALGCLELERVKGRIGKRRTLSYEYIKRLEPPFYPVEPNGDPSFYKLIVRFNGDRKQLKEHCRERGVSLTGEVYPYPIHQQPIFKRHYSDLTFPVAESYCKHHICPPNFPELSIDQVRYVCDVLNQW